MLGYTSIFLERREMELIENIHILIEQTMH